MATMETTMASNPACSGSSSSLVEILSDNKDLRTAILSHLTLTEIQDTIRGVCQQCRHGCDDYKQQVLEWLEQNTTDYDSVESVETREKKKKRILIVDLQSELGKPLNGRIATVNGPRVSSTGRYPILVDVNWLSGESETKGLKLSNIHAFYHQPNYVDLFSCPPTLKEYSSNAMIRESHGRLLQQFLGFARWFVMEVEEMEFPGDFNDFLDLPFSNNYGRLANPKIFDYWDKAPFRSSRSTVQFGNALDFVVGITLDHFPNVEEGSVESAAFGETWPADGDHGKNLFANFFHCMKSWKKERVTGGFWITDEYKTGTVMVHLSDIEDPESFSTVYIVKGHNGTIVKLMRSRLQLPGFCETTILPLYDMWTYDGTLLYGKYILASVGGKKFEKRLRNHVAAAIATRNVSWRGPSAENGLWNFENQVPPAPKKVEHDGDFYLIDWQDGQTPNTARALPSVEQLTFTSEEMELAKKIVSKAVELGGTRKLGIDELTVAPSEKSALTFRRATPGFCTILDTRVERKPLYFFNYEPDASTPCYPLIDVLVAILGAMSNASPHSLANHIYIDDRTIVPRLDGILELAFREKGLIAPAVEGW